MRLELRNSFAFIIASANMASLKSLREEIQRTEAIHEVMGSLEKVAVFERLRSQNFFNTIQKYDEDLLNFFNGLLPIKVGPAKAAKKSVPVLLCFGPDHGLTGPFAERFLDFIRGVVEKLDPKIVLATGKELEKTCKSAKLPFEIEFLTEGKTGRVSDNLINYVAEKVLKDLEDKKYTEVYLAAAKYLNFGEYEFYSDKIFRFDAVIDGDKNRLADFVFLEPSPHRILRRYVLLILASRFARPWREVRFIEASLRLLETNRAKENAKESVDELRVFYARTLRGKITRSINELFTGKAAFERRKRKKKVYFEWKV